jgi:pimeloyl-ACP methyl ester carboxylesterase
MQRFTLLKKLTLGLVLLLFVLLCGVLWLFPAYWFLRKYEQRLASGSGKPRRTEKNVAGVTVHLYDAPAKAGTTLIVVPGLHPKGIYDHRFIAFAETCAEAGFPVVAPDLPEFRNFKITNESLKILHSVIDEVRDSQKTLGMLGISYGAGPLFLLAAERKLDYIISIGGYYSLSHAIEYALTATHPGSLKRETHEWGRLIFALNHLDHLVPAEDLHILRESLVMRLDLREKEAGVLEEGLSAAGKNFMQGILEGLSIAQRKACDEILKQREKEAFEFCPQRVLSGIDRRTHVYLIHGTGDKAVPYEETLELEAGLKKAGLQTHCLITHGLTHVDVTKLSSIWELLKLLHWERLLLRERKG